MEEEPKTSMEMSAALIGMGEVEEGMGNPQTGSPSAVIFALHLRLAFLAMTAPFTVAAVEPLLCFCPFFAALVSKVHVIAADIKEVKSSSLYFLLFPFISLFSPLCSLLSSSSLLSPFFLFSLFLLLCPFLLLYTLPIPLSFPSLPLSLLSAPLSFPPASPSPEVLIIRSERRVEGAKGYFLETRF